MRFHISNSCRGKTSKVDFSNSKLKVVTEKNIQSRLWKTKIESRDGEKHPKSTFNVLTRHDLIKSCRDVVVFPLRIKDVMFMMEF